MASATVAISSPLNGATLNGASLTFSWNNTGADSYAIFVGTTPAANNLGIYTTAAGVTSTLVNLPANNSTIYVRLWSQNGANWTSNDYTYTSNP